MRFTVDFWATPAYFFLGTPPHSTVLKFPLPSTWRRAVASLCFHQPESSPLFLAHWAGWGRLYRPCLLPLFAWFPPDLDPPFAITISLALYFRATPLCSKSCLTFCVVVFLCPSHCRIHIVHFRHESLILSRRRCQCPLERPANSRDHVRTTPASKRIAVWRLAGCNIPKKKNPDIETTSRTLAVWSALHP